MLVALLFVVVVVVGGQLGVTALSRAESDRGVQEGVEEVKQTLAQHSQALQLLLNVTTRLLTQDRECPPPFRRVMNECFFPGKNPLTWDEARQHCRGMGGDLAAPEHLYALKSFFATEMSYLWIGGTKDIVEDQWRWVTGEALRPGDWCRGSPEITVGARDCIYMELDCHPPLRSGSCLGSRKYICQYRP
ncbi:type-2 ice-structuring protein-like [Homarus americanus]|uniref:type-2 ice-structuring protein-like n=1 Tax=Homarus americanus TaxID=6706 RepID=UPI001C47644D|nr:type-2 ice-structuring protein-like [Homarus americanus]